MIEIINSAWFTLVVDGGRNGYADVGVPGSAALDQFAYNLLNFLVGNENGAPVLEVMGNEFTVKVNCETTCAITGAQVTAYVDDKQITPWVSFAARTGSTIRVKQVLEGFRYYVGFSGLMNVDRVIDSYSTNLECRFGGFRGRPLIKGDRIGLKEPKVVGERFVPEEVIPAMEQPHVLRVLEGPEFHYFTSEAINRLFEKKDHSWYIVSTKSNRTGIRLEGKPLIFRKEMDKSITSEGILPGTIQVPGDGLPIFMLNERTIGGYARIGMVAKADQDRLAHLKPKDKVFFQLIGIDEAERLWRQKIELFYRTLPQ
ncbi:MAG: KipI antagonist [Syntrophorhabdus sp. PtaB.Bin027]|nr:MAG: KipI antagonist [Syntrophorhabdus sp. PtaB.Bin027]HQB33207.1 biotin-dependent carboxyltransferase family protein [Syntrophorhabdus sp.]HQO63345.1 biotin-dependent carboxyltransferase family protein [Syntrophorhabdus sp.]HQP56874.1 biotin-dependent carboxyltransferase family protein [Syntrophorhabdus sp.]